jgi:hypothetical protein
MFAAFALLEGSFGTSQNFLRVPLDYLVSSVVKKETSGGTKEGTETHRDLLVHDPLPFRTIDS